MFISAAGCTGAGAAAAVGGITFVSTDKRSLEVSMLQHSCASCCGFCSSITVFSSVSSMIFLTFNFGCPTASMLM